MGVFDATVGIALTALAASAIATSEPTKSDVVEFTPIHKVAPVYPINCAGPGYSFDYVLVEYDVTVEGKTANIEIIDSSRPCFHRSAIRAAKQFTYRPTMIDGLPIVQKGVRNEFTYEMGVQKFRRSVARKLRPVERLIDQKDGEGALRFLAEFEADRGKDLNYFERATFLRLRGAARIVSKDYVGAREDLRQALNMGRLDKDTESAIADVLKQLDTRLGD